LDHLFETSEGLVTGHPPDASSGYETGHEILHGVRLMGGGASSPSGMIGYGVPLQRENAEIKRSPDRLDPDLP
jgi:hypothetical protein